MISWENLKVMLLEEGTTRTNLDFEMLVLFRQHFPSQPWTSQALELGD